MPYLVVGRVCLAVLWVSTHFNPADHPSRSAPIPPPRSPPGWALRWFPGAFAAGAVLGLELFAGTAGITRAFESFGSAVLPPVDLIYGRDVMADFVEQLILTNILRWLWCAPPCCSFSPLRNLDKGGPLRPFPEGDENIAEIKLGNSFWKRGLHLCGLAISRGAHVILEHPAGSKAWRCSWTHEFITRHHLRVHRADWCMFGASNRKATKLCSNAPWISEVCRVCDRNHVHGPPLRGQRARLAAAYPEQFCKAVARACMGWWTSSSA